MLPHLSTFFKEERDPFYRRGYAAGLEKARQEYIVYNFEKGRIEAKMDTIKKMKEYGFEINFIQSIVNLPIEEIEKL